MKSNNMKNDYENYMVFKKWKSENFGKYTLHEKVYYDKEFNFIHDFSHLNVLELGYGNGGLMSYFRDRGATVVGVEINKELVDIARKNNFVTYTIDDFFKFSELKFDLIIAIDVLEHIEKEDLKDMVGLYFNQLNKGGHFFARFPNGDSPFGLRNQNGDITHRVQIGSELIKQLFLSLDAKNINVRGEVVSSGKGFLSFARSIIRKFVLKIVNTIVWFLFSSSGYYDFVSPNLVVLVKK